MNKSSQISNDLGNRFAQHLLALNSEITPAEAQALWLDIAARYNETQRAYHSLRHLQQLLVEFEQIAQYLCEPHLIALALYYHDVIYNPLRSDNEQKSADYMLDKLNCYLSDDQCHYVYALIMMTATHQLGELTNNQRRRDAAYLLDMDLSILGAPWPEYERYAQAVRCEYTHVPIADYRVGRTKVLKFLLAHSPLYLTDYYHQRLDVQARANIEREIMLLRASE
ncbi:hypothetical protein AAJP47_03125 [Psychrobacter sp. B38]|uniref:HD domain-containing protein n=1 Tax=Psychrobacter sp. B38 TaxID=3143538 RepID=UPI00320C5F29